MAATDDILSEGQIDEALAELPDWRYRLGGLVTVYKYGRRPRRWN